MTRVIYQTNHPIPGRWQQTPTPRRLVTLCHVAVKAKSSAALGRRIRQRRQELGLSQEDLAAPTYTAAYISHLEHGKRTPSRDALEHVASKLGLSYEQLVSGRDPNEDLRMELDVQRATSLIHQAKAQEALELLDDLVAEARSIGHARVADLAETARGKAFYRLGRIEDALATYERVLSKLADEAPERRASALAGKARCLLSMDEVQESIFLLESHLVELQGSSPPDPGSLVETYAVLIPAYFDLGMIERAVNAATKGWQLAPKVADPDQRACLYVNRALLLQTQGHHRDALASLALAEDLFRHLDWYSEAVKVSLARSFVFVESGQYQEAESLLRDALAVAGDTIDPGEESRTLSRLALVRRRLGDPAEGLALAKKALTLAGSGLVGPAADARRELGFCHLALGDGAAAVKAWRRALTDFRAAGLQPEVAATAKLLAGHLAENGDIAGALEVFRTGFEGVPDLS